ncbi:MAG: rRNA maturation RNase YbeY [Nitrospira sp.]|nr:rRNA maturation RNase YbeY [Nitrospira sp.]
MAVFLRVRLKWLSKRQNALVRAARTILDAVGESKSELSVELVGDGRMRRLNRVYRGNDRTTDVLAFAMRETKSPCRRLLGDVVISVPTAMRQAKEAGRSLNEELAALLVHGVLHLCGYDHERNEREAARMRRRERAVLRAMEVVPCLLKQRVRQAKRRL